MKQKSKLCSLYAALFFCAIMPALYSEGSTYIPPDIPGVEHRMVQEIRCQYMAQEKIKHISDALLRGDQYRRYIRKRLHELNMPSCLEYLPMLESDYIPSARSKDGKSAGMWQFMPNSTSPFLVRNEWVDERLDPWKSTDGALLKLRDNYRMFNDWLLAVGAYNCGAGAMAKALRNAPEKTFWYLAEHGLIPDHTVRYVPKLLAVCDIVWNSGYYGLVLPDTDMADKDNDAFMDNMAGQFDYITTKSMISLNALANELRLEADVFLQMNAALIKGVTPVKEEYSVRVPLGMKETAELALKRLERRACYVEVKRGDTLWHLSKEYDVSIEDICRANRIDIKSILKEGKILYMPLKTADNTYGEL